MENPTQYKDTMKGRTNPPTLDPLLIFEIDKLHNLKSHGYKGNIGIDGHDIVNDAAPTRQSGFKQKSPSRL